MTASEDDSNPVILMWDLRNAHAADRVITGHRKGILSVSWCPNDSSLLASAAKDNRVILWNAKSGEMHGEMAYTDNWAFDVQWCPRNPNFLSTASFDGKVSIYSLQFASTSAAIVSGAGSLTGSAHDDPFAPAPVSHAPISLTLRKPPRWFYRRCIAELHVGGKMACVTTKAGEKSRLLVSPFVAEEKFFEMANALEHATETESYGAFCQLRQAHASTEPEREFWAFLKIMLEPDARRKFLAYLGYIDQHDRMEQVTTNLASLRLLNASDSVEFHPRDASETDQLIMRAIVMGDFEAAVSLCIDAERFADAFALAVCGGQELLARVQELYLEKSKLPFAKILSALVRGDLQAVVEKSIIANWQDALALICTFAKADEFSSLCRLLAQRLEASPQAQLQQKAILCYVCAGSLTDIVRLLLGSTTPDIDQPLELQKLVEKITVFKVASGRELQECDALLSDVYLAYSYCLATQGKLVSAYKYLQNVAEDLRNNSEFARVLADLLYHGDVANAHFGRPKFSFKDMNLYDQVMAKRPEQVVPETRNSTMTSPVMNQSHPSFNYSPAVPAMPNFGGPSPSFASVPSYPTHGPAYGGATTYAPLQPVPPSTLIPPQPVAPPPMATYQAPSTTTSFERGATPTAYNDPPWVGLRKPAEAPRMQPITTPLASAPTVQYEQPAIHPSPMLHPGAATATVPPTQVARPPPPMAGTRPMQPPPMQSAQMSSVPPPMIPPQSVMSNHGPPLSQHLAAPPVQPVYSAPPKQSVAPQPAFNQQPAVAHASMAAPPANPAQNYQRPPAQVQQHPHSQSSVSASHSPAQIHTQPQPQQIPNQRVAPALPTEISKRTLFLAVLVSASNFA